MCMIMYERQTAMEEAESERARERERERKNAKNLTCEREGRAWLACWRTPQLSAHTTRTTSSHNENLHAYFTWGKQVKPACNVSGPWRIPVVAWNKHFFPKEMVCTTQTQQANKAMYVSRDIDEAGWGLHGCIPYKGTCTSGAWRPRRWWRPARPAQEMDPAVAIYLLCAHIHDVHSKMIMFYLLHAHMHGDTSEILAVSRLPCSSCWTGPSAATKETPSHFLAKPRRRHHNIARDPGSNTSHRCSTWDFLLVFIIPGIALTAIAIHNEVEVYFLLCFMEIAGQSCSWAAYYI